MRHIATTDGLDLAVHDLTDSPLDDSSSTTPDANPPTSGITETPTHQPDDTERRVLAAHATGFCATVWRPVARYLDDAHVLAPDFRGHGQTVTPPGYPFAWDRFADDVLATLDDAGWFDDDAPVTGIGHSMGGAALLLAEIRRPGTFAGLWVYEPITFPAEIRAFMAENENPLSIGARRRRPGFPSVDEAFTIYASKPPMGAFTPDALAGYVEGAFATAPDGSVTLRCRPEDEATVYGTAAGCSAFEHLGDVACPTVVARGRREAVGPAAIADAVADALPRGRLVAFEDLSHFGPMEAPDAIAASITDLW